MKTKIIPFDLETAKKIQEGEIKGKIKTRNLKHECTIVEYCVYTGHTCEERLLLVKYPAHDFEKEKLKVYHYDGRYMSKEEGEMWFDLVLEVPEEPQFKPFDKVLVRNSDRLCWVPRLFEFYSRGTEKYYCQDGAGYLQCIPYEGNEYLVGTTDEPKDK